ncbi:MAG: DUF507 family protein [Alphaproteobacteria bacterium]|nr:DUF507 family protein [Alphaproteobacteria bacterium]
MRLYRAKVPVIAKEVIEVLTTDGDIEVAPENRDEAEKDLEAIMEEFLRRDNSFRNSVRDHMDARKLPYNEYGRARKAIADETRHPLGDDVERYLGRQFVENMMISRFVEEVFSEDRVLYRKVMDVLKKHDVDEREIREAAVSRIKNLREGTIEYEIALGKAIRDEKKNRGLL